MTPKESLSSSIWYFKFIDCIYNRKGHSYTCPIWSTTAHFLGCLMHSACHLKAFSCIKTFCHHHSHMCKAFSFHLSMHWWSFSQWRESGSPAVPLARRDYSMQTMYPRLIPFFPWKQIKSLPQTANYTGCLLGAVLVALQGFCDD